MMNKNGWYVLGMAIFIVLTVFLVSGQNRKQAELETEAVKVRQAVAAGQFYAKDKDELEERIKSLTVAVNQEPKAKLKVLIVPHAGMDYSGMVAGAGFGLLKDKQIKRVVILGSSHTQQTEKSWIDDSEAWRTPLGETKVDKEAADKIADASDILIDGQIHAQDYILENELVFLQAVLGEFKIVPILVGQVNQTVFDKLFNRLTDILDDESLLVVSTDLSHYLDYDAAVKKDRRTIEAVLSGDPEEWDKLAEDSACGYEAVKIALKVSQRLGVDWQLIKYANSGDATEDKSRVVGYAAIAGYTDNKESFELSKEEQKEALVLARETLKSFLMTQKMPDYSPISGKFWLKRGVFTTLKQDDQLRGCIGQFEPDEPLFKTIEEIAVSAAINDKRFKPVKADELDRTVIEISVLTPKKPVADWREIELYKDGVVIEVGKRSGTFLPQVAQETNWGLEEFLGQLCEQKLELQKDCYLDKKAKLYVYQAQVFAEDALLKW